MAAKAEGLLEAYVSPEARHIDAQFKDAEGYWTGFYVGVLGFTLNDRGLPASSCKSPGAGPTFSTLRTGISS